MYQTTTYMPSHQNTVYTTPVPYIITWHHIPCQTTTYMSSHQNTFCITPKQVNALHSTSQHKSPNPNSVMVKAVAQQCSTTVLCTVTATSTKLLTIWPRIHHFVAICLIRLLLIITNYFSMYFHKQSNATVGAAREQTLTSPMRCLHRRDWPKRNLSI